MECGKPCGKKRNEKKVFNNGNDAGEFNRDVNMKSVS